MELYTLIFITVMFVGVIGVMFYVLKDSLKERRRLELYIMKMENLQIGRSVEDKKGKPKLSKIEKVKNKRRKTYNEILNSSSINREQIKTVGVENNLV